MCPACCSEVVDQFYRNLSEDRDRHARHCQRKQVRRLDPIPGGENRYSAVFNAVTRELYVRDFGDTTVFAYRDFTGAAVVERRHFSVAGAALFYRQSGSVAGGGGVDPRDVATPAL